MYRGSYAKKRLKKLYLYPCSSLDTTSWLIYFPSVRSCSPLRSSTLSHTYCVGNRSPWKGRPPRIQSRSTLLHTPRILIRFFKSCDLPNFELVADPYSQTRQIMSVELLCGLQEPNTSKEIVEFLRVIFHAHPILLNSLNLS